MFTRPPGVVQQRALLRRALETAFEKVLRRVLGMSPVVGFNGRKGSELSRRHPDPEKKTSSSWVVWISQGTVRALPDRKQKGRTKKKKMPEKKGEPVDHLQGSLGPSGAQNPEKV